MGEGSGMGGELCWVECQGFQASLNNDAKREYLIDQSDRFPRSAMAALELAFSPFPGFPPAARPKRSAAKF